MELAALARGLHLARTVTSNHDAAPEREKSGECPAPDDQDPANRRTDRRFSLAVDLARARCRSFEAEGALADVIPDGLRAFMLRLRSTACSVLNLSKGGMAVETRMNLRRGQRVTIQLQLPTHPEALVLSGTVRWQSRTPHTLSYKLAIQFDPFANREHCNPLAALDALRAAETAYAVA
jgi:Tfp pilus assembly protein PilZ